MKPDEINNKCVLVIDSDLPIGLVANTAAILGVTLGHKINTMIGEDVIDASNQCHLGITNIPIPILKGTKDKVKELLEEIKSRYEDDLTIVDFSETAQLSTDYENYSSQVNNLTADMMEYLGIGIYGPKKILNKLTGSMPLLR